MSLQLFRRAREIYSEDGPGALIKGAFKRVYRKSPFYTYVYQNKRRNATEDRWKMIEPELSEDDSNLLDIGCNAGMFCEFASENGILTFGVDRFATEETKEAALDRVRENNGISIMENTITPENIDDFPTFDVVLLLSVFHHWHAEFGEDSAKNMLEEFKDSRAIFFEPPSESHRYGDVKATYLNPADESKNIPEFTDHDKDSIIQFHMDILTDVFGDTHSIAVLGSSDRLGSERYLFLIEREE